MNKLYVVKDGVLNIGFVRNRKGERLRNINYYLLTYDYKSNVGYIEKKSAHLWRLYTSIGCNADFKSRYHHCTTFEECIDTLEDLFNLKTEIIIHTSEV